MDTVKQSPINNAFVSDCLAPRMGLLKNRGHMFSSSGQWSLYATHTPTQRSTPWIVKQQACRCNCNNQTDASHISVDMVHFYVTVYMRAKYLWGYLFKSYTDKHQQGVCNICVCVSLWRMAAEVTSLKSIHWWGPVYDPGPLRHINHNPFLLAFIRPAESYCPASAATPPSLITSLL